MSKVDKTKVEPTNSVWEDLSNFQFLNVSKAFLCSFLNIIIYAILILLISGFDQGSILMVDLYTDEDVNKRSLNVGLFHFLTYYLALIMSVYPQYIYKSLFLMDSDNISPNRFKWYMKRKGIILFNDNHEPRDRVVDIKNNPFEGKKIKFHTLAFLESNVRKFVGVFLFIIWSGLIVGAYERYHLPEKYGCWNYYIYGLMVLFFLYAFWWITVEFKRKLAKAGDKYKTYFKVVNFIYTNQKSFFIFLIFIFIIVLNTLKWSAVTIWFQVVICFFLALYLTLYRTTRQMIKDRVDEADFINSIRMMGAVVLVFIFGLNFSKEFASFINPINVVLASLILLYTIVTMWIKVFLYFRDNKAIKIGFVTISKKVYYGLMIAGFIFFGYNYYNGNDLHKLKLVDAFQEDKVITLDTFYHRFKNNCNKVDRVPILYAAYGGGLKAHYWNYLILEQFEEKGCFEDVLAMSGVSGGGMGICNFTAMEYLDLCDSSRQAVINTIKSTNVLSMELSYLLGADFIREYLPTIPFWKNDRSHRSMTFYNDNLIDEWLSGVHNSKSDTCKIMKPDLVNVVSFDSVYTSLFEDGEYYPNIIINSTATTDKSGIVSAVRTDTMFPGTINLLDITYKEENKTLTFLEAASTCNRFPYISPAANIPNKGHFVDGGYYENSGVMSLISFKEALEEYEATLDSTNVSIFKDTIHLFSVRNDKANYIQSLMETVLDSLSNADNKYWQVDLYSNEDYTETRAVLSSIFNLERTPTFLREYLNKYHREQYKFYFIELPFYIDTSEIEDFYGGELHPSVFEGLAREVLKSNGQIETHLKSSIDYDFSNLGIINPPTARLLSKPVQLYMEAMMGHDRVKAQLQLLFDNHEEEKGHE